MSDGNYMVYRHQGMVFLDATNDIATALRLMADLWTEYEGQHCIEIIYRPTGEIAAHIGSHGDWK